MPGIILSNIFPVLYIIILTMRRLSGKLGAKYPELISLAELETFFNSPLVIDLYNDIVRKYTEWPTYSYSVKDLAQYLGFR